ncbi:SusC/RagA family TonB-linked outer membrane protein [Niabella drilacis]|nr:SusC/RagA family TonB-linked outer membrane protein [Niabella drilacis]
MRRLFAVMQVLVLLWLPAVLNAQTRTVTGIVTDSKTGQPLAGVTITVVGTNIAALTDTTGAYRVAVDSRADRLTFSSIGYTEQRVPIAGAQLNVRLVPEITNLDNVVVIAYGTRRKTDLTGAVTAITAKDFQKGNIASSEQLLQGKVAGLQVTSGGGAAGGGSKIRIRGAASLNASNDPLIVIDGVPVEGNSVSGSANLLNTINPNDIESISILKDASATALYGSRATNGVMIITTKKGASGKPRFNFNTRGSLGVVAKKIDVLSGDQIRDIVNASGNNTYIPLLGTANTDWQNEIYRSAAGFDNNLSVSGRADLGTSVKLPYRLSAGYLTQQGNLKTNNFDRFTTALNLNPKFFQDHLSININAKYANTKNVFADEGAIGAAVAFDPTQSVRKDWNRFSGFYEWVQANGDVNKNASRNPVALLELKDNRSSVDRFIGNVQLDYKLHFLPDLHVLVNLGVDQSTGSGTAILDSTSAISVTDFSGLGNISRYKQSKKSQLADVQLFYQKDLSDGYKIDALLGHGYQDFFTTDYNFYNLYQTGKEVPGQEINYPVVKNGYGIDSYLGRLNFTMAGNYLLTATLRRDASSKFSRENRVGYFPSFAFAWKLKEAFFQSTSINELKLRLGWGITGQQDGIAYNSYLPLYYQSQSSAQYQFGDVFYRLYRPTAFNKDLKWETSGTFNAGIDFAFAQNRINGSMDVYSKRTKNLLSYVDIAPGSNFDITQLRNIGELKNTGFEFSINTVPYKNEDFSWDLNFNFTYNKSEIKALYSNVKDPEYKGFPVSGITGGTGNKVGIHAVGYAPYTFFVRQQVYDSGGKPIEGLYEDVNRDGKISDADNSYYKKPAPDFLFGMATGVTYKKLSVGITGHGMAGNYLYNNYNANSAVLRNVLNPVISLGNTGANYLETNFANNQYLSNYYIENASFFRIDNINMGYNFGKISQSRFRLSVNASVQNVAVFTKYSGADPESANSSGVDNNIYPRPRIFSLGANLDF